MAFRKDRTTAAQTAANTAGAITAAQIAAVSGLTAAKAAEYAVTVFKALFAELAPVVDADNVVFAEAEEQERASGGSRSRSRSGGGSKKGETPATPGDVVFFGGKFKGCTIAEVYAMSEELAKERDHPYGAGSTYIINYVATDKNTNDTTREAAKAFLAALQEG